MGDGGLEKVPGAIQLVLDGEFGPAFVGFDEREVGVEVTVGLLRGGDLGDEIVEVGVQLGVGRGVEHVGRRLR